MSRDVIISVKRWPIRGRCDTSGGSQMHTGNGVRRRTRAGVAGHVLRTSGSRICLDVGSWEININEVYLHENVTQGSPHCKVLEYFWSAERLCTVFFGRVSSTRIEYQACTIIHKTIKTSMSSMASGSSFSSHNSKEWVRLVSYVHVQGQASSISTMHLPRMPLSPHETTPLKDRWETSAHNASLRCRPGRGHALFVRIAVSSHHPSHLQITIPLHILDYTYI